MTLPANVIKKDHDLEQDYDTIGMELMEHRWHWTLDESNAKRVTIAEYGRSVGRDSSTIRADVNGWRDKIAEEGRTTLTNQSEKLTKTPNDYRKKAALGAERQVAAEAIAKAKGKTVGRVVDAHREEITAVVGRARERAEKRGTSVEDEINRAAELDAKADATRERMRKEHKARHTSRYIETEGDLGVVMQRLRKVLTVAEDVGYTEEETDLISEALAKVRALMALIDLRIAGQTDIDWDAEFQKIDK